MAIGGEAMGNRVCFLVAEHPFLDARIFKKEAKSLVQKGYDVTIIVPRRKGFLFDINGTLMKDRFLEVSFMHEGVRIHTYDPPTGKQQPARQLSYLRTGKVDPLPSPLIKLAVKHEADVYHAHEFASCYDAIMVKRILSLKGKDTRLIYDSHELVPDAKERMSQIVRGKLEEIRAQMFEELDTVITVSASIQQTYQRINRNVPIEVLFNSPFLSPYDQKARVGNSPLVLGYVGRMDEHKGCLAKLIQILDYGNQSIDLRAKIIGGQTEANIIELPHHLRDKVDIVGWLPYTSVAQALSGVDIGWIEINTNNSLNRMYSMPNKFFSYLERGIPPLVNQSKDMKTFIQKYKCGFVVKEDATPLDFADALIQLNDNWKEVSETGKRARKVMEDWFSWEHMEQKLFAIYERLLKSGKR